MDILKAADNLKKRGFDVTIVETKDEARDYLSGKLAGQIIGFGGSMTLKEMGLQDALSAKNTVWNHWVDSPNEARQKAATADVYIASANAVSETGEIINIDGAGNRVSSTLWGHKEMYYVVGINKFEDTYEKALWRARNVASPKNAQRLNAKTPCAVNADRCYDCDSPARICHGLTVLWRPMAGIGRTEVVIVKAPLGY